MKTPSRHRADASGVHAAAFTALIRASRRRDAWLGGAVEGEDSFPYMDGEHLAAYPRPYIEYVQTHGTGEGATVAARSSRVALADDDDASTRLTAFVS